MRYIEKRPEPVSFQHWKAQANTNWQPSYDDLRGPEKNDLHLSLMEEQGFLCCYCECRINETCSDIEHLKPRRRFPLNELDYNNLLASCLGGGGLGLPAGHCNGKKGNWYDAAMVSPLQGDCGEYFMFTRDGQILPTQDPDQRDSAEETINRLNLNSERLIARREEALDGTFVRLAQNRGDLVDGSEDEDFTAEQLEARASACMQFDLGGRLEPFCSAIHSVIRQKMAMIRE